MCNGEASRCNFLSTKHARVPLFPFLSSFFFFFNDFFFQERVIIITRLIASAIFPAMEIAFRVKLPPIQSASISTTKANLLTPISGQGPILGGNCASNGNE